jgi:hypothetical protein
MVMADPEEIPTRPHFEPGAKVRVRYGVTVPDFEDIPLGGWTGTVETVEHFEDQTDYEVEWDRRTLDAMHPVYRKRCERDGLDVQTMWLTGEDLEPDDGTPSPSSNRRRSTRRRCRRRTGTIGSAWAWG